MQKAHPAWGVEMLPLCGISISSCRCYAPSSANLVSSALYLVEVGFGRKKRWNIAFAHCGCAPKFCGQLRMSTPVILNSSCQIPWLRVYYDTG